MKKTSSLEGLTAGTGYALKGSLQDLMFGGAHCRNWFSLEGAHCRDFCLEGLTAGTGYVKHGHREFRGAHCRDNCLKGPRDFCFGGG